MAVPRASIGPVPEETFLLYVSRARFRRCRISSASPLATGPWPCSAEREPDLLGVRKFRVEHERRSVISGDLEAHVAG